MQCPECDKEFTQRGFKFCPYDGARLMAPSRRAGAKADAQSGRTLKGRYRIRRFLAKGAMARIYIAEDETTGGLVAVKVLDREKAKHQESRERFLREANAIRLIQHENIVSIHEVGEDDDGTPFLVMEFLAGESLKETFERDGAMDPRVGLPILIQATDALFAAHAKGIVHRDIKPDNLFIVGDDPHKPQLRVLDFGLSRLFQSKLTTAGTVIGTPGYMAPEQVVADPVDQRTDIYGLGMVMYRMFVGRLPFDGSDDITILAKQLLHSPARPTHFKPDVHPGIERVIMTAIHKRPENRFPSMKIFGDDLRKLERHELHLWAPEPQADRYDSSSLQATQIASAYRRLLEKHS